MDTLASVWFAVIGVMTAEFLFQGTLLLASEPERLGDFAIVLGVLFVVSFVFLEPVAERLSVLLGLRGEGLRPPGRSGGLWGAIAVVIALCFAAIESSVEEAIHHSPVGSLVLFGALLFVPGLVTLGWICGARRGRAALYGGILAFATDLIARMAFWGVTGSVNADPAAPPYDVITAVSVAVGGGIQAAFYAGCGGLALDRLSRDRPVRNLSMAIGVALLVWVTAYHFVGGMVGWPNPDIPSQGRALVARLVDYGGWLLGLAVCAGFGRAVRRGAGVAG